MKEINRYETSPVDYIRHLFDNTRDGRLTLIYEPEVKADSYMYILLMDWTEEDVRALIERYSTLETQLIMQRKTIFHLLLYMIFEFWK